MKNQRLIGLLILAAMLELGAITLVQLNEGHMNATTPRYNYNVVNVYPHDENAFTQGLVFEDGFLYEGTGLYGNSSLRRVELETGKVLQVHALQNQFFGEGITIVGDKIIQLTWESQRGFIYDKNTFDLLR